MLRQNNFWWFSSAVTKDPNLEDRFNKNQGLAAMSPEWQEDHDWEMTNDKLEQSDFDFLNQDEPIRVHSPTNNVHSPSSENRCSSTSTYMTEGCVDMTNDYAGVNQIIDDLTMGETNLDQLYSQDFDSLFTLTV